TRLSSGKRLGCSTDSTARSTSRSGQYRWLRCGNSTLQSAPIETSRNHGNCLNETNSSRPLMRSQKPCCDTFVTSTSEVGLPRTAYFILVRLNQLECLDESTPA